MAPRRCAGEAARPRSGASMATGLGPPLPLTRRIVVLGHRRGRRISLYVPVSYLPLCLRWCLCEREYGGVCTDWCHPRRGHGDEERLVHGLVKG